MVNHSSSLAWRIPWAEESSKLQSMGLQRVGRIQLSRYHLHFHTCTFGKLGGTDSALIW